MPDLPPLEQPEIHLSLNGLTLRLYDPVSGFEKVDPVGPGAIETNPGSPIYGESLSYNAVRFNGSNRFEIRPSTIQPCKTWHTPTGVPLFAGLPFLSFYGNYGIHGPIENYRSAHGGDLTRGFVSHGCFRMEAADISEVYARIKGVARVPVTMHRDVEYRADGSRVDVDEDWIGSECATDDDCGFEGGLCKQNKFTGTGWCTAACDRFCEDKAGYPGSFCVADPDDREQGICVNQVTLKNHECRPTPGFAPRTTGRFGEPSVSRAVCLPGQGGFVGDTCFDVGDCLEDHECAGADAEGAPGVCVQPCDRFCPDLPGYAMTFCAADNGLLDGGACLRTCDPAAPNCGPGQTCTEKPRAGQPDRTETVCVPTERPTHPSALALDLDLDLDLTSPSARARDHVRPHQPCPCPGPCPKVRRPRCAAQSTPARAPDRPQARSSRGPPGVAPGVVPHFQPNRLTSCTFPAPGRTKAPPTPRIPPRRHPRGRAPL